jgi:hypothetical protein
MGGGGVVVYLFIHLDTYLGVNEVEVSGGCSEVVIVGIWGFCDEPMKFGGVSVVVGCVCGSEDELRGIGRMHMPLPRGYLLLSSSLSLSPPPPTRPSSLFSHLLILPVLRYPSAVISSGDALALSSAFGSTSTGSVYGC